MRWRQSRRHCKRQILVIRDCIRHRALAAEQLQALRQGFRRAFEQAQQRKNHNSKRLLQQVARDDGTPAALPTSAASAATKGKKSGVSYGECCVNLGYRVPQGKSMARFFCLLSIAIAGLSLVSCEP